MSTFFDELIKLVRSWVVNLVRACIRFSHLTRTSLILGLIEWNLIGEIEMRLADRVALITGAARGLGKTYSMALAAQGASVFLTDRSSCEDVVSSIIQSGGSAASCISDVSDMSDCLAAADMAISEFGRLDILVNNAALYGSLERGHFETLPGSQWDDVMAVNIKGTWHCSKAVLPAMRDAGGGSIINIASLAAVYGMPQGLDYVASKAAVIGMTRAMARELGDDKIRVNAIAPSAVMTEGTSEFFGDRFEKATSAIAEMQVLKHRMEPEDLVGTLIYLASDDSLMVTGQTHMVDGGSWFL